MVVSVHDAFRCLMKLEDNGVGVDYHALKIGVCVELWSYVARMTWGSLSTFAIRV